ncbi:MAG: fluoride efflux transporter FluC [Anaerobutyricum sp.]
MKPPCFPVKTFLSTSQAALLSPLLPCFASKGSISNPKFILFLKTGICGGFTTFSTFSLESSTLIKEGHPKVAFLYMVLSLLAGVCTIFATELVLE